MVALTNEDSFVWPDVSDRDRTEKLDMLHLFLAPTEKLGYFEVEHWLVVLSMKTFDVYPIDKDRGLG